jgi:hypothetical protein
VLAITRYDGRGAISLADSVKGQHILPFFSNFVALAARLESLLGTPTPAPGAPTSPAAACALPALLSARCNSALGSFSRSPCVLLKELRMGRELREAKERNRGVDWGMCMQQAAARA